MRIDKSAVRFDPESPLIPLEIELRTALTSDIGKEKGPGPMEPETLF